MPTSFCRELALCKVDSHDGGHNWFGNVTMRPPAFEGESNVRRYLIRVADRYRDVIVEASNREEEEAHRTYYIVGEQPAVRSETYSLVGFEPAAPVDPLITLTVFGLALIEQQERFQDANVLAETLADSVVRNVRSGIAEILETVRGQSSPSSFADLIAALGTVELGSALQNILEYLRGLEAGEDERLKQAAEDAIDLIQFAQAS